MPMGFSFQPGADQLMGQGQNGQAGRSVSAPDSSVKVLSFRMPKRDNQSFAPQSLLQAQGGGAAGLGGLSPQILALLLNAFSAGPRGLTGSSDGPFTGSSDPAGVVGPAPGMGGGSLTPKFTIGDGPDRFRLDEDLGPGLAAGGPPTGEIPQGGMRQPGTMGEWGGSPMPRYDMDLGFRMDPDLFR